MFYCQKQPWRNIRTVADMPSALVAVRQLLSPVRVQISQEERVKLQNLVMNVGFDDFSKEFAENFSKISFYDAAPVDVVVVPQAIFISKRSLLILPHNGVCDELDYECDVSGIPDLFVENNQKLVFNSWYQQEIAGAPNINGVSLIVHPKWHSNYTHWHVEGLTSILDSSPPTNLFDNICVPATTSTQSKSLSIIKDLPSICELDKPVYRMDVAVLPSHSLFRTFLHPSVGDGISRAQSYLSGSYPAAANMFWHSVGVTMSMMRPMAAHSVSMVRAASFRRRALILANRFSIGLKSGL